MFSTPVAKILKPLLSFSIANFTARYCNQCCLTTRSGERVPPINYQRVDKVYRLKSLAVAQLPAAGGICYDSVEASPWERRCHGQTRRLTFRPRRGLQSSS